MYNLLGGSEEERQQAKAIFQYMDEWKSVWTSGPAQILRIYTNQEWDIIKGSKDETGASTLIHDKASSIVEKQSHQFSYKD